MLNVIEMSVIVLSVIMLSVIMLIVIMLSVMVLSRMVPSLIFVSKGRSLLIKGGTVTCSTRVSSGLTPQLWEKHTKNFPAANTLAYSSVKK
jgi:hypothetical protein